MRRSLGLVAILALTGCVHYMPAAVSSAGLGPHERPVRVVTGESSAYYVFGFGPTGNDSLEAAIEDAKSQAKCDTIVNVFVDRKLTCFPICGLSLITKITTSVYGTLVEYTDKTETLPPLAKPEMQKSIPNLEDKFEKIQKGTPVRLGLTSGEEISGTYQGIDYKNHSIWIRPPAGGFMSDKSYRLDTVHSANIAGTKVE